MNDPVEVIESLGELSRCIESGSARIGFVLQLGYEKWISDLLGEAIRLKNVCLKEIDHLDDEQG